MQFAKEAQKTAEKVSETAGAFAEEVAKTDVGQAIKKVGINYSIIVMFLVVAGVQLLPCPPQ